MSASATQGGRNKFWQHQAVKLDFWATVCKTVRNILSDRCLSVCLSVLSVTLVYCGQTVGRINHQDETWHAGKPRPWPHCARWEPSSPFPEKGAQPPNFRPISIVAKLLDASRCHLVQRQASAQAALCYMGPSSHLPKGAQPPPPKKMFGPSLSWPNGRPSQLLLNTCTADLTSTGNR